MKREQLVKIRGVLLWIKFYPAVSEPETGFYNEAEIIEVLVDKTDIYELLSDSMLKEIQEKLD